MKIEIDLANLGFNYDEDGDVAGRSTVHEAVVAAAATRVAKNVERDERREVRDQAQQIVRDRIAAMVAEEMAKPIQRTSPWGETQGAPVTVRELIRTELEKFLSAQGSRDQYGSYGRPGEYKNMADLIKDSVRDVMNRELAAAVTEAKKSVHDHITQAALKAAAEKLSGTVVR